MTVWAFSLFPCAVNDKHGCTEGSMSLTGLAGMVELRRRECRVLVLRSS